MPEIKDKSIGDLMRELKPAELWTILGALLGLLSAVFWAGYKLSDYIDKGTIDALQGKNIALERHINKLEKYDIPSLANGKLAVPCPRKQYEIVKFYKELGAAVRSHDRHRILDFYHKKYNNKGTLRDSVLKQFDPLLGKNIIFEVSTLRIADDEKIAANVVGTLSPDETIDSYDSLIYEGSRWWFIN
jgi:hypothetical protein